MYINFLWFRSVNRPWHIMLKKLCSWGAVIMLMCNVIMLMLSKSDPGFVVIVFMVCESADTERVFFFFLLQDYVELSVMLEYNSHSNEYMK